MRLAPRIDLHEIVAGERRWRAAQNVFGDDYNMSVVIDVLADDQAEGVLQKHDVIANLESERAGPIEVDPRT